MLRPASQTPEPAAAALARKPGERRPDLEVLLTSGASEAIMHRGTGDGAVETLPKPCQVEGPARHVSASLDQQACPARGPQT